MSAEREAEIRKLCAERWVLWQRSFERPDLASELEALMSKLLKLKEEEAEEIRQRNERNAFLKPGEGWAALEEAKKLLRKYEKNEQE